MLFSIKTPTWSPDGSQIAFVYSNPDFRELGGLYIVNKDGTGLKRIIYNGDLNGDDEVFHIGDWQ